ncbi:MAG: sigma-54 dependent transcriptional regulator [Desulfobacterales bacterium]
MLPSVLIVDDEQSIVQSLSGLLSDEGFDVSTAVNGYEALKAIDSESPDVVLLDIWMPGIDGIETLKEIKKYNPHIQVIIITGHGTIETAVKATKLGAFDLVEKPLSIDKIILAINNALNFRRLEEENKYLRTKTLEKHSIDGDSERTKELRRNIEVAAPTDTWILISGENGTGKELVARTIHRLSPRAEQPLIDVSCAAISDEFMESEMFGHEKGAFAGATASSQAKILRVLQEQTIQRVGGSRPISFNARVIATTNKNLEKEIEKKTFREDLFYRLNVIPIHVPPLRDRIEDLPLLVESFLEEFAVQNRSKRKLMSPAAISMLSNYDWPGNVRELRNLVERLAIMVAKDTIDTEDIPESYRPGGLSNPSRMVSAPFMKLDNFKEARRAFEKEFIQIKLIQNENNITKTAKTMKVGRSYLHKKIKSLN